MFEFELYRFKAQSLVGHRNRLFAGFDIARKRPYGIHALDDDVGLLMNRLEEIELVILGDRD